MDLIDLLLFLGLKHDDCLELTPDVAEALRRLPTRLVDERNYRIIRALQCSTTKSILPRDQWTKYEEVWKVYYKLFYSNVQKPSLRKGHGINKWLGNITLFLTCGNLLRKFQSLVYCKAVFVTILMVYIGF